METNTLIDHFVNSQSDHFVNSQSDHFVNSQSDREANIVIIYNQIKGLPTLENLEASDIITLVIKLIPIVQKTINGKNQGAYKKQIVIGVLNIVIKESNINSEAKDALYLLVSTTIPFTIDTIISVANGEIDISKHAKNIGICFGCFGI